MSLSQILPFLLAYAISLWLGSYLIGRDPANRALRRTGLGLLSYALALACILLNQFSNQSTSGFLLTALCPLLLIFPAVFWTGAVIQLLPIDPGQRRRLDRIWLFGQPPLALLLYFLGQNNSVSGSDPAFDPVYFLFILVVLLPLLASLFVLLRLARGVEARNPLLFLLFALLLFTLSTAFILLPVRWLPPSWLVTALGLDLVLLGIAIAILDTFDLGESLLPDLARSFILSTSGVLLFGGLVLLTARFSTGLSAGMVALLLAILAAVILIQTQAEYIQGAYDRLIFSQSPVLRRERSELRGTAKALGRVNRGYDIAAADENELIRLTRRALSNYGNLPRLASSPLTQLDLVNRRLQERTANPTTLDRASELKRLLREGILQLKPDSSAGFGETEEWRFYNALYFPYVAGLRPYSRRADQSDLPSPEKEALEWFRTYVPERTFHNWQTAGARLVAQYLREQDTGGRADGP